MQNPESLKARLCWVLAHRAGQALSPGALASRKLQPGSWQLKHVVSYWLLAALNNQGLRVILGLGRAFHTLSVIQDRLQESGGFSHHFEQYSQAPLGHSEAWVQTEALPAERGRSQAD